MSSLITSFSHAPINIKVGHPTRGEEEVMEFVIASEIFVGVHADFAPTMLTAFGKCNEPNNASGWSNWNLPLTKKHQLVNVVAGCILEQNCTLQWIDGDGGEFVIDKTSELEPLAEYDPNVIYCDFS